jgi:hypothetical protein
MVGRASLTTVTFCIAIQPLASFTYTSHDKLAKLVSTESTGLLPYAPVSGAVALPATTAYVYAPVPPNTLYLP